jgi:hypothetical protein
VVGVVLHRERQRGRGAQTGRGRGDRERGRERQREREMRAFEKLKLRSSYGSNMIRKGKGK